MTAADENYSYSSPPLAEVIAEVRWKLTPLGTVPGGGVDPYYLKFRDWLATRLAGQGYSFKEPLVDADVPLEFIGGNPTIRFRRGAQQWPLYQLGPGLLAMNLTAPYGGWEQFRPVIAGGLAALHDFFGKEGQLFQLSMLKLQYVDAFTANNGMKNYETFVQNDLQFLRPAEGGIWPALGLDKAKAKVSGQIVTDVDSPERSTFTLRVRSGKRSGEDAAVLDYIVARNEDLGWPKDLAPWFEEAHILCRKAFEATISDEVRRTFGQRTVHDKG